MSVLLPKYGQSYVRPVVGSVGVFLACMGVCVNFWIIFIVRYSIHLDYIGYVVAGWFLLLICKEYIEYKAVLRADVGYSIYFCNKGISLLVSYYFHHTKIRCDIIWLYRIKSCL